MDNEKLARLLTRFAVAAKIHYEALEAMDEGRANKQARLLAGLHEAIVGEGEAGRLALLALVDDENGVVAGLAAVYSLREDSPRCLAVLRRLAGEPGLLGFRASVALQRWEDGELG